MMGIAANLFGWTPDTFWRSTMHEWWGCYEVYQEINKPRTPAP